MTTLKPKWAAAIAATAGVFGWLGISHLSRRPEAWDSDLYFSLFLPSIVVVVAALGFFAPHRAWRWGFVPFIAQGLLVVVQNPGANLLPIGLVVFAFYGALCSIPAILGAALRERLESRGTNT
jgi:hypothetical protein